MKTVSQEASRQVRAFNRFYSKVMGALNQSVLDSPFSIAEARVLFEIKHLDSPTASEINRELGLDPGYLSRIIRRFEQDGLLTKERSPQDGRAFLLKLSEQGSKILTSLEKKADKRAAELLSSLPERDQPLLLRSMGSIRSLLTALVAHLRDNCPEEAEPMADLLTRQSARITRRLAQERKAQEGGDA